MNKAKTILLAAWLLCAPVLANTTADGDKAADAAPSTTAAASVTVTPATPIQPVPAVSAPSKPPVRITLLLPLRSDAFGAAAQALRSGFIAAAEREPAGVEVKVIETADGPQNALLAYTDSLPQTDIIVGPMARADVAAVAQSGKVDKPTLALAQPDAGGDAEISIPPKMLVVGLSAEDEARQAASMAGGVRKHAKALVIGTPTAWQRRAARAFATEWQRLGNDVQQIELGSSGGYLHASGVAQIKKRLEEDRPNLMFYALDADQARQLQSAIGKNHVVYGTSQLNPWTVADWRSAERRPEMNGVRLIDFPWMLQPEHTAVMVYPRPVVAADQRANPDLERLYALGIDAFRIAREIALQRTEFELDGVTGKLSVRFGKGTARFQRTEQPAVYQDGMVVPYVR